MWGRHGPVDLLEAAAPSLTSSPSATELEDIAVAAAEFNLSMSEAVDQFGWRDNFGLLAGTIAAEFPTDFARAEIVNGNSGWIAFAAEPAQTTKELVRTFQSAFPHVNIELRPDVDFTAVELNETVMAVHARVMTRLDVKDAVTEYWSDCRSLRK